MKSNSIENTGLIILIVIYNLVAMFTSLFWLFTKRIDWIKIVVFGDLEKEILLVQFSYFFFAGILGGSFYCLRALYRRLGQAHTPKGVSKKENLPNHSIVFNLRVWLFWYLYRPIQGGILSIILICLFNQGFISLNKASAEDMGSLFFQVAIGFLVGFGSHEVIGKIEEVIKVLFAKNSDGNPNNETESGNGS